MSKFEDIKSQIQSRSALLAEDSTDEFLFRSHDELNARPTKRYVRMPKTPRRTKKAKAALVQARAQVILFLRQQSNSNSE